MPVPGAHPLITIIVLFIVFFAIFFLLIYGILQFAERRKTGKREASNGEIPTYAQYKTCPRCGVTMPGVASFCPECGTQQIAAQS